MSDFDVKVAVHIPSRDEEATVSAVVAGFRTVLPEATVYLYDNGSVDQTVARALEAGTVIGFDPAFGKGSCGAQDVRRRRA